MAAEGYIKLMSRRFDPHRILNMCPEYLQILKDGVENIVSINRVTLTRAQNIYNDIPQYSPVSSNEHEDFQFGKQRKEVNNTQEGGTYVVVKISKHADTSEGRRHLVRWYGYRFAEDTLELEENLPKNFIDRYWKVVKKSKKNLNRSACLNISHFTFTKN